MQKDIKEIIKLSKHAPEVYNDIIVNGDVIIKGRRECSKRWELIKPYINNNSVIIDIGSECGYFTTQIANNFRDSLVLSFESNEIRAKIQEKIARIHKASNVIVFNEKLDADKINKWLQNVETVDTVLLMSVLHHFTYDGAIALLQSLSVSIPNLIIEFPSYNELKVYNRSVVGKLSPIYETLKKFYKNVKTIGFIKSHLANVNREILFASNARIERNKLASYYGNVYGKKYNVSYINKQWYINNKSLKYNGVNLYNMFLFNIIYPDTNDIALEFKNKVNNLINMGINVNDPTAWNCIYTPMGIELIDYYDKNVAGEPMSKTVQKRFKMSIDVIKHGNIIKSPVEFDGECQRHDN